MAGFRLERKSKAPAAAPDSAEEVAVAVAGEEPASPAAGPAAAERAEGPGGGDTVQVNCHLPLAAHTKLRLASVRQGVPLAAVLTGLVERHLPEA